METKQFGNYNLRLPITQYRAAGAKCWDTSTSYNDVMRAILDGRIPYFLSNNFEGEALPDENVLYTYVASNPVYPDYDDINPDTNFVVCVRFDTVLGTQSVPQSLYFIGATGDSPMTAKYTG